MQHIRFSLAFCGGLLCATTVGIAPLRGEAPEPEAVDALTDLNRAFLAAHAVARGINLRDGGPVVTLANGTLTLMRGSEESRVPVIPPEFDTYKTFAHLPVALVLMLGPAGPGPLDSQRIELLRDYQNRLQRVADRLDRIGLSGEEWERQRRLLTSSQQFLAEVLSRGSVDQSTLRQWAHSLQPGIEENLTAAAHLQIDSLHRQMLSWRDDLSPDEWQQLRVVIFGAVLARDGNLAKQYFEKLLGLDGEGVRMVYMERYVEPNPMLTLLATRTVDQQIGIAIFDDPDRMFRDVLADASAEYLKTFHFGPPEPIPAAGAP